MGGELEDTRTQEIAQPDMPVPSLMPKAHRSQGRKGRRARERAKRKQARREVEYLEGVIRGNWAEEHKSKLEAEEVSDTTSSDSRSDSGVDAEQGEESKGEQLSIRSSSAEEDSDEELEDIDAEEDSESVGSLEDATIVEREVEEAIHTLQADREHHPEINDTPVAEVDFEAAKQQPLQSCRMTEPFEKSRVEEMKSLISIGASHGTPVSPD